MELMYRRIRQIWTLIRLLVARVLTPFTDYTDIWLISERGKEARDNGYALYKWMKTNHPEIRLRYIISKDSKDYHRIAIEDVVEYNSFRQLLCIWGARYLISTHIMGFTPDHQFFYNLDSRFHIFRNKIKIFLQHGIIKDYLEALFHRNIDVDLFISGSAIEYDYVKENFGFPDGIVKYTGLCRFDALNQFQAKKQILIMPTFRIYLDRNRFEYSDYYCAYRDLLCDPGFADLVERYDYNVVFYPHYEFQAKISLFKKLSLSSRITIADMTYDVQQLLKESSVLITDFSSVFFDMMYMNKPVVFYQFDEDRYRSEHYKKGYLDYREVGPVVNTLSDLVRTIQSVLSDDYDVRAYQDYYNRTFTNRDAYNCKRVYEAILQCQCIE